MLLLSFAFSCVPEFFQVQEGKTFTISHCDDALDLTPFGIAYHPMVDESSVLSPTDRDKPLPEASLHVIAQTLQPGALPVAIEIQRWSIYITDSLKRRENLEKLIFVIESLREVRPNLQFGFADVVPKRVYDPQADLTLSDCLQLNDAAKVDFVPHVDAIFPTLYTVYPDPKAWKTFAIHTLKEAKRFNKPVYAFLSPKFHQRNSLLRGQYLPADFWRLELETCLQYCDGIVIRDPDPLKDAQWLKETVAFITELNESGSFQNPFTPK